MADQMSSFREAVRTLLSEYAEYRPSVGEVETKLILDDSSGHYELIHVGWLGTRRVHGAVLHIDVPDGKVIIQHDGTPDTVAEILAERGVPRDKIVLAFKPSVIRPHTGFVAA